MRAWITHLLPALCASSLLAGAAHAEPLRVLILLILVHSAADDAAYVSAGLADMLSSRLEQLGDLRVTRAGKGGTTELGKALEAASGSRADYVIYGAFTQFGDGASLDVHCAPTINAEEAAARRRIFIQSGNVSEIIPRLDELVDRVAHFLNRPAAAQVTDTVATTPGNPSPELDALRQRIDALEQAVYGLSPDATDAAAIPIDAAPES